MVGTALLIAAALVLVGVCILTLRVSRRRRIERARGAPEGALRERAEVLRRLSGDMDRENASRVRHEALNMLGQ
jgi:hypothetical protein